MKENMEKEERFAKEFMREQVRYCEVNYAIKRPQLLSKCLQTILPPAYSVNMCIHR